MRDDAYITRSARTVFMDEKLTWLEQIADDRDLLKTAVRVAMKIATRYINFDTGDAWPSQKGLAADLSVSASSIEKAIGVLVERGHLSMKRGGWGHTSRYRWIIKDGITDPERTGDQGAGAHKATLDPEKTTDQGNVGNIFDPERIGALTRKELGKNPLREPFEGERSTYSAPLSRLSTQKGSLTSGVEGDIPTVSRGETDAGPRAERASLRPSPPASEKEPSPQKETQDKKTAPLPVREFWFVFHSHWPGGDDMASDAFEAEFQRTEIAWTTLAAHGEDMAAIIEAARAYTERTRPSLGRERDRAPETGARDRGVSCLGAADDPDRGGRAGHHGGHEDMLTIYQRGDVWHYRGSIAGRRLRGTTGATKKADARKIADRIAAEAWQRHIDGPTANVTFAQAAIAYRDAEKPDRFLDRIEDYWKDTMIREIAPGAIRQSAIKLYPDASAATRNRQVIVPTVAIINHAADLGWVSPIRVKRFPEEPVERRPATLAWVEAFAAQADADGLPHLAALCLFMFGTGARIGEAIGMRWTDVDLEARVVTLRGRKPRPWSRVAHLPPPVVAALASLPGERHGGDTVFGYAERGSVSKVWRNVVARAGIEALTPHCCRHGFATTLLQAGVDVATVAKRGGWKDVGILLKHYAHALDDHTVTDRLFGGGLTQNQGGAMLSASKQGRKCS
jgi:integrase